MVITFLAVFTLEPHNTFVLNPILQKPTKKKQQEKDTKLSFSSGQKSKCR